MRIGAEEYPLISGPLAPLGPVYSPGVIKAILTEKPYAIEALLVSNNLLICLPNSREVYKALKKVPFLVVREFFMTPTAEMADILLPAAHWCPRTRRLRIRSAQPLSSSGVRRIP